MKERIGENEPPRDKPRGIKPTANKNRKIIFFAGLFVLIIFCIFSIILFSSKYNIKESASIGIIGGADGPTAVYISGKENWGNILLHLLITVAVDIIIFTIIKIIEHKIKKSLLKLNLVIIAIFNIILSVLLSMLLFPGAIIPLLFVNIITIFVMKLIYDIRKNKSLKKIQ